MNAYFKQFERSLHALDEEIVIQNEAAEKEIYHKLGQFTMAKLFKRSLSTDTLNRLADFIERKGKSVNCSWKDLKELLPEFIRSSLQRTQLVREQKIANINARINSVSMHSNGPSNRSYYPNQERFRRPRNMANNAPHRIHAMHSAYSNNARRPRLPRLSRDEHIKRCATQACPFGVNCNRGENCWYHHSDQEKAQIKEKLAAKRSEGTSINMIDLDYTDASALEQRNATRNDSYFQ